MEGEATQGKAELFTCLEFLFSKFVKKEDIRLLANVLKKHDVISGDQEKKVYSACDNKNFDNAIEKLTDCVAKGDKRDNLDKALQDEGFPADQEARAMLSQLVHVEDENLIFIVKNWENMAKCENLKSLVAGDGSSTSRDEDWVKALASAAFDEIVLGKEEKPIFDSIENSVSMLPTAESSSATSDESVSIAHEPTGSSDYSSGKAEHTSTASENVEEQTNITDQPLITLLPHEPSIDNTEPDECILEIRAVAAESLPSDTILYIACKESEWKPKEMRYNERKGYFYLRIRHNSCGIFKYKFCYKTHFMENVEWETLPDHSDANRILHLEKVKIPFTFILNACCFKSSAKYWTENCSKSMGKFLPNFGAGANLGIRESQTSLMVDLLYWMNCVIEGWSIEFYASKLKPSESDFEEILLEWLDTLCSSSLGDEKEKYLKIRVALVLAVAFADAKHFIVDQKLLVTLFNMLTLHGLDMKNCEKVYVAALKDFQGLTEFRDNLPHYHEAMEWFYRHIPVKPNLNWLFSLPLYWFLVHGEVRNEVLKPIPKRSFLDARSSLPFISEFDWTDVAKICSSTDERITGDMIATVLETAKLHPWIISTFQFLLTYRELGTLILRREDFNIVMRFPLDATFVQYFRGYSEGHYSDFKKEDHQICEKYFHERLLDAIKHASSKIPYQDQIKQLAMCTSIMNFMNQFLELKLQVLDNAEIFWCIGGTAPKVAYWANLLDLVEEDFKEFREQLVTMLKLVERRIRTQSTVNVEEVKHWNRLLEIEWTFDWFAHKWKEHIIYEIDYAIKNSWFNVESKRMESESYLEFFVNQLSDINLVKDLAKSFDEVAVTCTENILKTSEEVVKKAAWRRGSNQPKTWVFALFEKLFIKTYKEAETAGQPEVTIALNFFCNWSFSAHFYKLFGRELPDAFTTETKNAVKKVAQNFTKVVKSLDDAEITVEHLMTILDNKERFLSVSAVLNMNKEECAATSADGHTREYPKHAIEVCEKYLSTFMQTKAAVKDFIHVCDYLDYDDGSSIPHEKLLFKARLKVLNKRVCDLVTFKHDGEPSSNDFFDITEEQFVEFQQISFIKDSHLIFRDMFTKVGSKIGSGGDGEIGKQWIGLVVFTDVKHQVFDFVEEIDAGTITMDSVIQRFKIVKGKRKVIDHEIELFYDFFSQFHHSNIKTEKKGGRKLVNRELRKKQIFNTFHLQSADEAVNILLELRDMMGLGGNFDILIDRKTLIEHPENVELRSVPETLEISEVSSIGAKNLTILTKFMEEEHVIKWLQKTMKELTEVKVLCDLAMISAGENAYEVDRVSSFFSAVIGFAPLIFWAKEGRETSGLRQLLERCRKVWENALSDEHLLAKWKDVSRNLQWLKSIEASYGSVEKSSLTLAQKINEQGIYKIGRQCYNEPITVENCIGLRTSEGTDGIEQFRELQSKLMFIVGETENNEQEVNAFFDVLTSVQNLAEVYVQLIKSGCVLFAAWEAYIMCRGERTLRIEIQFLEDAPRIIGNGSHTEIDELTKILNKTLERWNKHVSAKRIEYCHLNKYNIQQIVHLCRELANVQEQKEISEQARSLLTFVREEFDVEDLKQFLQDAQKKIRWDYDQGGSESQDEMKKKIQLVRTLTSQEDFTEDEAKAAVQANGADDLSSCMKWILLNGLDEELVAKYSTEFDDDMDFVQQDQEKEVAHPVFNPNSENTLKEVIGRLQEEIHTVDAMDFLNCVHTVCAGYLDETIALNLQDYINIDLLGTFLDILCKEVRIHRNLVPGLRVGRPNLIICDEEEVLPTVLSLYMHNEDQPLPGRSEVLVCSEETGSEEVERFLRSMCETKNGGQLIHTLAFANKLNYSTSSKLEDIFNELSKSGKFDEKYQLVIVLDNQRHYLTTCFEKYVVDGKWSQSTDKIQSYLKRHLQVAEIGTSAASVTHGNYMVNVVKSTRSGAGKSLYVQRLVEKLQKKTDMDSFNVTIRLLEKKLDLDYVIEKLKRIEGGSHDIDAVLIHVDLTPAVERGIEAFAFDLFVLGSIHGSDGEVWKTHHDHLYVLEMTDCGDAGEKRFSNRHILNLLPYVKCNTPRDVLNSMGSIDGEWLGMDEAEFHSETFQRPFQYLRRYQNNEDIDEFMYEKPQGSPQECLEVLLHHCCIGNPSWAQLRYFCSFLNAQLENCEKSVYCTNPFIKSDLAGLKLFAVKFTIKMAQEFAMPSFQISDNEVTDSSIATEIGMPGFQEHQVCRKWEDSSRSYVFLNEDGMTMTFINVKINDEGFLVGQNGIVGEERMATPELVTALQRQGFSFSQNFDDYSRVRKLRTLFQVIGVQDVFDPDPTYELTLDNVLKIAAIYKRFQCQIPVIIMGETGCGKTRLIQFMSKLKEGRRKVKNMLTHKVHGGTTTKNIHQSVTEARLTEIQNRENGDDFTVLFYDEANATEAIYAIKEVMCDKTIDGESFRDSKLQIIAACNPYKKLSQEAIKKLEASGLGYRIPTRETARLFGNVPVRSLVYRVVALPPSIQPFVWDFGQLGDDAEKSYIQQMTRKLALKLGLSQRTTTMINNVLSSCQQYMRTRRDMCRYVSLRDVERCMQTYEWFYARRHTIYAAVDRHIKKHLTMSDFPPPAIDDEVRTLIQTIGVCYHASLDCREPFREQFAMWLNLPGIDRRSIETELASCQNVFLQNIRIGDNIARNKALRENVFMMAVCTDMKIPLFLIGKPGSSKTLSKTIIANNMRGEFSTGPLYRRLKEAHLLSYQCSCLTDAEVIERIFSQCRQLQAKQNPDTYTAVVVLDEIGLAEDSPNMPLKVLHPLLESPSIYHSTIADQDTERVGFIGISNWALDPAKMNRGIFVTRNQPDENDLSKTGKEIFQAKPSIWRDNKTLFGMLTNTYLEMYKNQNGEYFSLRDYYSLMKMICSRCKESDTEVKFSEIVYAILRNFSGGKYQVAEGFLENTREALGIIETTPTIPVEKMIKDNLKETDTRFLLLLVNQFSVVSSLLSCIKNSANDPQVVFGSGFPGDNTSTEIRRNISRIKFCMRTGKTLISLNMALIHESLYDALNQHYVTYGGQNYVDLGLGGHRVKCRIADNFRLIVIEKKEVVYREYPIPLINRLEKHHFNSDSLLDAEQKSEAKLLSNWASEFVKNDFLFSFRHAFLGFNDDTISSIILTTEGDSHDYKSVLLQSCSMDAILRLPDSNLHANEVEYLQKVYFTEQQHDNLADVLKKEILAENPLSMLEITSYSGVLSKKDVERLHSDLELHKGTIILLSLEQFYTQQEYSVQLDKFFGGCFRRENDGTPVVLLIQCAKAQSQASLISCARHCLMSKIRSAKTQISGTEIPVNITVALLLSTERKGTNLSKMDALLLQPTRGTRIIHVDELRPTDDYISPASIFFGKSLSDVFEAGKEELKSERHLESLVNIQSLLVNCVIESVAKFKDRTKDIERYFKRIKILMNLCSSEDIAGDNFRKILLKKVVQIASEMEEEDQGITNWITDKANDRESLQEGGTFRKTLWLCLKGHMSRFMAYIISAIDRQDNMDLLAKIPAVPWELNMWLGMFDQLETSWQNVKSGAKYMIHGSWKQSSCKLPFSFLIIDYLQTQWNALELQSSENFEESFFRLFHDFGMKKIITGALDSAKIDVLKNFILDLIGSLYHAATEDNAEIEIVQKVLFDIAMKNLDMARSKKYFLKGDEIAVIFLTFKALSDQLEKFSEILQGCSQVLRNSTKWNKEQKNAKEFILHILAFKDVVNLLKNMAGRIQDVISCLHWIDLARTAKKNFDSVSGVLNDAAVLETLKRDWVPLLLLDMFLSQLLPPAHADNEKFRNFVKVIAPHAKLLWRGSVSTDVRSYNFLRIVLNMLKRCYADINLHLLVNWHDTNCRFCIKKIQNPIFLPCGHFACEDCIRLLVRSYKRCMMCTAQIPDDFTPHPADLDEGQTRTLKKLKSNCTSFFLEYLQHFCFKNTTGASGNMEQHVQQILKELIIQSTNKDDRKELDPTGLDLNINAKSCMIQILSQHNQVLVVKQLNQLLKETEGDMKSSLITVILKHLEQKIRTKFSKFSGDKRKSTNVWQEILGSSCHALLAIEERADLNVEFLQKVAELRGVLIYFISIVDERQRGVEFLKDVQVRVESFFHFCLHLLKSDNMPQIVRDFVIKAGCRMFGMQWFYQMAEHRDLRVLTPPALRQAAEGCNVDHWVLLCQEYSQTTSELYQIDGEDARREVATILDHATGDPLPHVLALTSWSGKKEQDVKDMVAAILRQKYGGNNFFVRFLVGKKEGLKFLLEANLATLEQTSILYQLILLVVAATTVQNDIMRGFYDTVVDPQITRGRFLPSMPEDIYFATPANYRSGNMAQTSMYRCPRGHLYSIGDCTRPYVTARCPECQSTIGGTGHRVAAGNEKILKTEQSQAGYKFPDGGIVTTGAERMSPQGASVTQFLLNSCLLLGSLDSGPTVANILQCFNVQQAQQFLIQQLQDNLWELSRSLARNINDTVLVIHKILIRIINQGPKWHIENWATLEGRRTWEQTFRREYLLPIFQNLETEIAYAQAVLREVEGAGNIPLNRLIHEIPDDEEPIPDSPLEEKSLWNLIEHPSSAHLMQVLHDKVDKNNGEVLQIILHTPDLHYVQFLENVLKLQQKLTERYQYEIDMKDADQITFRNHVEDGIHSDENAIESYIFAWNQIYKSLQNVAPDYLSDYFEPLSLDSPLSMALPSIGGRGQCAKILAEYLICIQNQFLTKCADVTTWNIARLREVEVRHLRSTDFVCINKQKDLLNLINMHTSYTITSDDQGRHHLIAYNIEALEKQAREKFVFCKKLIKKNTIPCIKYPQDVGIGIDWQKVAFSIPQEPLSDKLSQDMDRIIERSLFSEICEGVRTLTNAISFLAMVKANSSKPLCEFLEKDLKLPSSRTSIIPRSAQISHVLSLYQRLTWHRAIIFVKQGLDPYKEALSGIAQELISEEVVFATLKAFEHTDVKMLQQRINEMLITGTGIGSPEWRLIEDVFPYLQFLGSDTYDDSWYLRLPENLCNKHLGDLFRLAVINIEGTFAMDSHEIDTTGKFGHRRMYTAEVTPVTRTSSSKAMKIGLPEELDRRIKTKSTKSKIIGPDGGFVENFGCKITFRKGTFKKNTKVETSVITDFTDCRDDRMPVAPIIECTPTGALDPPALLEIRHWVFPIRNDKTQYVEVFRKHGEEAHLEFVAKVPLEENRSLSLKIDHFTLFDFVMWKLAGQATLQNRVYISNAHQSIACVCCLKDEKVASDVEQSMKVSNYVPLLPLPETVHVRAGNDVTIRITCAAPQGLRIAPQQNEIGGMEVASVFSVNAIVRKCAEIRCLPISIENDVLGNFNGLLKFTYSHNVVGENVQHALQTRWPIPGAAPTHIANVVNTYGNIQTEAIVGPNPRELEN